MNRIKYLMYSFLVVGVSCLFGLSVSARSALKGGDENVHRVKKLEFGNPFRPMTTQESGHLSGVGSMMCWNDDEFRWNWYASAFVTSLSRRHVLTAAHVIQSDRVECRGIVAPATSAFYVSACRELYEVESFKPYGRAGVNYSAARDLAIITLRKPLCDQARGLQLKVANDVMYSALKKSGAAIAFTFGTPNADLPKQSLRSVPVGPHYDGKSIVHVSAPKQLISHGRLGSIREFNDGEAIEYDMDTEGGASGGALLAQTSNGGYVAIGSHVGFENDQTHFNWGVGFSEVLIRWIRNSIADDRSK